MSIPKSVLKTSPIGDAYKAAKKASADEVVISDLKPYALSNGAPAAFMMTKVQDRAGKLKGFVALQIPFNKINDIMLQRVGMGKTGETYLVGIHSGCDRRHKLGSFGRDR